jgi:hypothetical protein
VITDTAAGVERDAVTVRHLARETRASPERTDVIRGAIAVFSTESVAADAAIDQVGMALNGRPGLEPSLSSASGRRLLTKTSAVAKSSLRC